MRRAAKIDRNQPEIVRDLRKMGFSVWITSGCGDGAPDLVVGKGSKCLPVELKDPLQPPSKRRLTEDERAFHAAWTGPILVAETTEQILKAMGV